MKEKCRKCKTFKNCICVDCEEHKSCTKACKTECKDYQEAYFQVNRK